MSGIGGRCARTLAFAHALLVVAASAGEAQQPRSKLPVRLAAEARPAAAPKVDTAARPAPAPATADTGSRDERELAPVVVANALPRTYRLVRVAVPVELTARDVAYEVVSVGTVTVLGSRHGLLGKGADDRAAVLTVGVASTALAGRGTVAYVRFSAAGAEPVRVPVLLDVLPKHSLHLSTDQSMRGAKSGDRFEVAFEISNLGNVADTVGLALESPESWSAQLATSRAIVVAPGETVRRQARISVARSSGGGLFTVSAVATRRGETAARTSLQVEVAGDIRAMAIGGPALTVGVGSVSVGDAPPRSVESVSIDGAVSDLVAVRGQLSTPATGGPEASRAVALMGYASQANFITLVTPHVAATAGAAGMGLNDLSGETVFGRGGSLRLRSGSGDIEALAASPINGSSERWKAPSLFAGAATFRVSSASVSAFMAHLRDSSVLTRELDAFGVGAEGSPWQDGSVSAQIAERRYRDGSGMGIAADARGPVAGADVDVRLLRAPGGSAAFAPAQDAVSATVGRSFARLRTDASYWDSRDRNALMSLGSSGWSVSPTLTSARWLSLGLDVRRSGYRSSGDQGTFASDQTEYGGRAHLKALGFDASAETRFAEISREATGLGNGGDSQEESARRLTNRARLDRRAFHGVIGVAASFETAVDAAGSVPPQTILDAHVERVALIPGVSNVVLNAAVQRMQVGSSALTTSRLELDLDLTHGVRAIAGWERGTIRDATGAMRSIATIRLEHTTSLPRLRQRFATGVVFQDRNGNGERDDDEPGLPGVVVRRGTETAVSDANGGFRLTPGVGGMVEIDSRSLPDGWLQSPRFIGHRDALELGVIPTSGIEVKVILAPNADGSLPSVHVGTATLVLRDSTGREWLVRTGATQRATFDALPSGRYTLTAELENSSEPLVVDAIPVIDMAGAPGRRQITVTVRTRPVRMFRPRA